MSLLQASRGQGRWVSPPLERAQDATDDRSVGDRGDDPPGTWVTTRTALQVDGQDALEQTGPAPSRRDRTGGQFASPLARRWRDGPSPVAVRGQTPCLSHLVDSWRGDPGCHLLEPFQWREVDPHRAIRPAYLFGGIPALVTAVNAFRGGARRFKTQVILSELATARPGLNAGQPLGE